MSPEKLAKTLSFILGPQAWLPTLLLIMIFNTNLSVNQISILLPAGLILGVFVPLLYLCIAPRVGLAESWELQNKKERYPFMAVTFTASLILLFFINSFGNKLIQDLYLILLTVLALIYFISIFWKISLHVALNMFSAIIINFLFNWSLPVLYLVVPLIFWARLFLKRHTILQLLAGLTISFLISFGGLRFFGYF